MEHATVSLVELENAAVSAAHAAGEVLRRRFREVVRTEIAQTVQDPREVADELRHLIEALSA